MRKRKRDWNIRVYKYGVFLKDSSTPYPIIATEARAMQDMWNDLLAKETAKTSRYREIIRSMPNMESIQAEIARRKEDYEHGLATLRLARQQARKRTIPELPAIQEIIARRKAALHEVFAREKELRQTAKNQARGQIEALQAEHDGDLRYLRSTIKTVDGSNREFILDKFKAAAGAARKKGLALYTKTGFPTEINLCHLFTMGWPVHRIFGESSTKVGFGEIKQGTAKRHRPTVDCRFLVRGENINFTVFYNRPLPENALIKSVILHGEQIRKAGFQRSRKDGQTYRVNARWEWSLLVTLEIPHPETTDEDDRLYASCGIDVGYRLFNKEELRVATLVGSDGHREELRLPRQMLDTLRYIWAIQSQADTEMVEFVKQLRDIAIPDDLSEEGRGLLQSGIGFPGLRRLHAELEKCLPCEMKRQVTRWMVHNTSLYFRYRGTHRHLIRWRKDLYRKWAYRVVHRYGTIRVEDLDMKSIGEHEKETLGHGEIGKYRAFAAVGSLLLIIEQMAKKYYRTHEKVDPAGTTIICAVCGAQAIGDRSVLHLQCENGHVWDQDQNAAINIQHVPLVASA